MTDVLLNKLQTIRRCLRRIDEEYAGDFSNLENITKQDAIILNLQKACEASISLAMHIVSLRNFGVPQHSRETFTMLAERGVITADLALRMNAMVGFRNIAIHDYQKVKLDVVKKIIELNLRDFREFSDAMQRADA